MGSSSGDQPFGFSTGHGQDNPTSTPSPHLRSATDHGSWRTPLSGHAIRVSRGKRFYRSCRNGTKHPGLSVQELGHASGYSQTPLKHSPPPLPSAPTRSTRYMQNHHASIQTVASPWHNGESQTRASSDYHIYNCSTRLNSWEKASSCPPATRNSCRT